MILLFKKGVILMREFLLGLPVTLAMLFVIIVPTMIFGEIYTYILEILLIIVALCLISYAIGLMIIEK